MLLRELLKINEAVESNAAAEARKAIEAYFAKTKVFGDGFYLCANDPTISESVDDYHNEASDAELPKLAAAIKSGSVKFFSTYSGDSGDSGAWVEGAVKELKTDIDTYAFKQDEEDDEGKIAEMSASLSKELGAPVDLDEVANSVAKACIVSMKVKGGYLLIVATDD